MPCPPAPPLRLRTGDRARLEAVVRKRTAAQRDVLRARIILCCADGLPHRQTKRTLHTSVDAVLRWRSRYEAEGLDGLKDRPRSGRPAEYSEQERGEIMAIARTDPQALDLPFGYWSLDRLLEYVNVELSIPIGRSQLHRVLQAEGLRWYQEKTYFTERPDPQFAEKRGP